MADCALCVPPVLGRSAGLGPGCASKIGVSPDQCSGMPQSGMSGVFVISYSRVGNKQARCLWHRAEGRSIRVLLPFGIQFGPLPDGDGSFARAHDGDSINAPASSRSRVLRVALSAVDQRHASSRFAWCPIGCLSRAPRCSSSQAARTPIRSHGAQEAQTGKSAHAGAGARGASMDTAHRACGRHPGVDDCGRRGTCSSPPADLAPGPGSGLLAGCAVPAALSQPRC